MFKGNSIERKKMYKAGKNWLVAGMTVFSVGAANQEVVQGLADHANLGGVNASAEEVSATNKQAVAEATGNTTSDATVKTDGSVVDSKTTSSTDSKVSSADDSKVGSTVESKASSDADSKTTSSADSQAKSQADSSAPLASEAPAAVPVAPAATTVVATPTAETITAANQDAATNAIEEQIQADVTTDLKNALATLPATYKVTSDDQAKAINVKVPAGQAPDPASFDGILNWANTNGYTVNVEAMLAATTAPEITVGQTTDLTSGNVNANISGTGTGITAKVDDKFKGYGSAAGTLSSGSKNLTKTNNQVGVVSLGNMFNMSEDVTLTGSFTLSKTSGFNVSSLGDAAGIILSPVD
ncbi:MAG: KxYKxGKxW signal peptide domain-containing protein, partial [Lactobacillaceae bacterium]|nr:KxYKxGKxW signal peptide domain-containing protein [Lactobacillaceae bacterium]